MMRGYYEITVEVDGRRCCGMWKLRQGGRVRVASFWGADEVDCAPPMRPEVVAATALAAIVRAYPKVQAEALERRQREIARVNRYWDEQQAGPGIKKARPPRRASRAKVRRDGEESAGSE